MSNKKFYETPEFLALQKEYYQKLEASGFNDIEKSEEEYIVKPQILSPNRQVSVQGLDYYELCHQILREYKFKRDVDRIIFEAHTERLSVREIAKQISMHTDYKFSKSGIDKIINQIKEDFIKGV